jgi:hypothetical protein
VTAFRSTFDGQLMPAYDAQQLGNSLGWGLVSDAPNSFVWEIGHTSPFTNPASAFCLPGQVGCYSYHAPAWAGTRPILIRGVTFGDGRASKKWAVVSDFGGKAKVNQTCAVYGGDYCIYPWFTLGAGGYHYGVDYPDTVKDYGQAAGDAVRRAFWRQLDLLLDRPPIEASDACSRLSRLKTVRPSPPSDEASHVLCSASRRMRPRCGGSLSAACVRGLLLKLC